ncbi:hypothetical protein N7463_008663 [Penicillium fimorum]|uniref:Uncharacterized protein n=1 Tax=Penicillium fimorum TaxID=1882269 RepID=A0A9X0C3M8_9EURO|nr:hypothetical protein N7463_008663 [Penicillium fimorum]
MPQEKGENKGQQAAGVRSKTHATQKATHSDLGPTELLSEHMDASGKPVPDPRPLRDDDTDLVEAMTADTSDFEEE